MKHHCSKYHPHLLRTFLKITQQLFHWISPRHYSPLFFSRSIVVTSLKQNLSRYRQTIDFRQSITGTNAQETRSKMIGCSLGTRNAFQVKRTRPNAKDFFPPPPFCVYQFLRIFIGNGGRERGGACPVKGPRRVNPASGLSTRSFLPCVSKRKRGEEESRREKRKRRGEGPPLMPRGKIR